MNDILSVFRKLSKFSVQDDKVWHSFKTKPRFLILLINLKTEQHNKGRESGDKGAQRYGRQENGVRVTGGFDPPFPPPPPQSESSWKWNPRTTITPVGCFTTELYVPGSHGKIDHILG